MPMMTIMIIGTGIPMMVPPKKLTMPEVEIGRPSEMTKVKPRATDIMASVAIKEGNLRNAFIIPDKAPNTAPASRPTMMVTPAGSPMLAPV